MANLPSSAATDYTFKVCLCGEAGVGKSWFLAQALHALNDKPPPEQLGVRVTIGMDIKTLVVQHKGSGKRVSLMVWDTAGQEEVRESLPGFYWRNAHVILFVYDICSKQSFDARQWWIGKGLHAHSARDPFVVVIGNKVDRDVTLRQVAQQEVADECHRLNYSFMEVSARTGEHVAEAIAQIVDALLVRDGLDRAATECNSARKEPAASVGGTVSLVPPSAPQNSAVGCGC